jgi:hypothetical protein
MQFSGNFHTAGQREMNTPVSSSICNSVLANSAAEGDFIYLETKLMLHLFQVAHALLHESKEYLSCFQDSYAYDKWCV